MLRRIEQKKEKRKKIIMGLVLAFLMVFGILGIMIGGQSQEKLEYNGFKFIKEGNFYITEVDRQKMGFNFYPPQLEYINVSSSAIQKLRGIPMIYLVFHPDAEQQDLVYIDVVRKDLTETIDTVIVSGMTKESKTYALPVISCENATVFVPVILFNSSNQTSITEKDNCVILNGRGTDFLKLRDLLIYKLFGIIN